MRLPDVTFLVNVHDISLCAVSAFPQPAAPLLCCAHSHDTKPSFWADCKRRSSVAFAMGLPMPGQRYGRCAQTVAPAAGSFEERQERQLEKQV